MICVLYMCLCCYVDVVFDVCVCVDVCGILDVVL